MTEITTTRPEKEADGPNVVAIPAAAARARPAQDPVLRRRMRKQAQLLVLVSLLMLMTALSVPFVLHYLGIIIP
jgi:hypothetical protein